MTSQFLRGTVGVDSSLTGGNMSKSPFVFVSSTGMHNLAASVHEAVMQMQSAADIPHLKIEIKTFSNGEHCTQIPDTVRSQHVFFFHGLQFPTPNEAFMDMMIVCDAMMRASVASITLVVPYMSYLRQDRKDKPRVPITARLLADMIETNAKVAHIITMDMHADQEQGFFKIPVDNLSSKKLFAEHILSLFQKNIDDVVVVAPDFGSAKRARKFAEEIGIGNRVAICEKTRPADNRAEVLSVIGTSVTGRIVVMYDDMIDTGGTIAKAAAALRAEPHAAKQVVVLATHGIFSSKDGVEELASSGALVFVTDSIPRVPESLPSAIGYVSIATLLASAVHQHMLVGGSVSVLS